MENEVINAGYKIFDRQRIGHKEIVIGHSLTAPQPYVTWESFEHSGYNNFMTGHYFSDLKKARVDFYTRIAQAWEHYEPAKKKEHPPKFREHER